MHALTACTARPAGTGREYRPAREHRPARDLRPPRRRGLGSTARRVAVDLTPQAVEQVACRVAQLLGHPERQRQEPRLISAGELALCLGVSRPWIYKHRRLLGGRRIGEGPKAPWRFDRQTALEALERLQAAQHTEGGV
jgi:hypothetical protein